MKTKKTALQKDFNPLVKKNFKLGLQSQRDFRAKYEDLRETFNKALLKFCIEEKLVDSKAKSLDDVDVDQITRVYSTVSLYWNKIQLEIYMSGNIYLYGTSHPSAKCGNGIELDEYYAYNPAQAILILEALFDN